MKNQIHKFAAVAVAAAILTGGAQYALAQSSAPGVAGPTNISAGAGTAAAVPAGYSVIPADDSNRSDDQIVQLENLTIKSISGAVPGTIYATREFGAICREYLDVNAITGSKILPCPLAPTVLYQISVQADTILLLKNRTRASIADFAIGDRINVFGFMDRGTSGVQALIIRDLDKPVAPVASRYVQLNNLTLVSGPAATVAPTTFQAARIGTEPCVEFPPSTLAARPTICPMGVDISTSVDLLKSPSAELYRPFREYYTIRVNASTRLMNLLRAPIGLGNIQAGDHINVYGLYNAATRGIDAIIVRDLSVTSAAQPSLIVAVSDKSIVCITAPCGQLDGVRVDAHVLDSEGDDTPELVASSYTANGQAVFRNLKPGRYVVNLSAAGYETVGQQVVLSGSGTVRITLDTSRI